MGIELGRGRVDGVVLIVSVLVSVLVSVCSSSAAATVQL